VAIADTTQDARPQFDVARTEIASLEAALEGAADDTDGDGNGEASTGQ
jgi:hypothetical protein